MRFDQFELSEHLPGVFLPSVCAAPASGGLPHVLPHCFEIEVFTGFVRDDDGIHALAGAVQVHFGNFGWGHLPGCTPRTPVAAATRCNRLQRELADGQDDDLAFGGRVFFCLRDDDRLRCRGNPVYIVAQGFFAKVLRGGFASIGKRR